MTPKWEISSQTPNTIARRITTNWIACIIFQHRLLNPFYCETSYFITKKQIFRQLSHFFLKIENPPAKISSGLSSSKKACYRLRERMLFHIYRERHVNNRGKATIPLYHIDSFFKVIGANLNLTNSITRSRPWCGAILKTECIYRYKLHSFKQANSLIDGYI